MTEPQESPEIAPAGPDDAAARHEDGRYINHETGEPYDLVVPEPVPGATPWTNADVRAMAEGRSPSRPEPWTEAEGVGQEGGTVTFNVPGRIEVDTGQKPVNVTPDGVNHFLRIVDGVSVCGGCGEPWRCDKAVAIQAASQEAAAAGSEAHRLQALAAITGGNPHALVGRIGPS